MQQASFEEVGAPEKPRAERIFSVSEFIEVINVFFKQRNFQVSGEVAQCKRWPSGHVYFSIKDKACEAILDAIIWDRDYRLSGIELKDGLEVILTGRPNIYAKTGRFSFVASSIELVGEGALKKAYDALKLKLEKEGAFDTARKRPLPEYPERIGIITSLKGAVIHDFQNNLGKFGLHLKVIDSRVEGQQAARPLHSAIERMRSEELDLLVIIRGGGSLESLQAFNNETLIRAVIDFPVPVIAGIGHDQDVPLLALAADHMTSTPTAAAHLVCESWREAHARIQGLSGLFIRFPLRLAAVRNSLNSTLSNLLNAFSVQLANARQVVVLGEQAIRHNDPARQLKLGYSIVKMNDKVVRGIKDLELGNELDIHLSDGRIGAKIEKINGKNE